jgi:hypothetical protein
VAVALNCLLVAKSAVDPQDCPSGTVGPDSLSLGKAISNREVIFGALDEALIIISAVSKAETGQRMLEEAVVEVQKGRTALARMMTGTRPAGIPPEQRHDDVGAG